MNLPDFSVKHRVALVTGAGRGIGLAIAQALAGAGAAVAIQDIELDVARAEADAITRAGGRAVALGGDATDIAGADSLVEQTVARLGELDILVNNAGIQARDNFLSCSIDDMRRQFDCNIFFATRLCQLAIPNMQRNKWGRIVNVGSVQGLLGNSQMPAYAMSKAALVNLTVSLARSYGKDGITANCIAPGWFNTFRNKDDFTDEADMIEKGKRVPVGRVGQPADCAGLALLLCSRAGEYITGQTIYVDGGIVSR